MTEEEKIQALYIAYLERPADPGGLAYWVERLNRCGRDFRAIGSEFFNSEEFKSLHGSASVTEIVKSVYEHVLAREPDKEGLAFWIGMVEKGMLPLEMVPAAMVEEKTVKGKDTLTLLNKVQSAMSFTKAIDPELDGKDVLATYSGEDDLSFARRFLMKVDSDLKTVKDISEAELFISSHIADDGDPLLEIMRKKADLLLDLAKEKSSKENSFSDLPDSSLDEVKALLSGVRWAKDTVTYSFSLSKDAIYGSLKSLSGVEKQIVREAFEKISKYVDLHFEEVPSGGDIQIVSADLPAGIGGVTAYSSESGRFLSPVVIYLDNDLQNFESRYFCSSGFYFLGWGVVLIYHEILHALGLKHPFEGEFILAKEVDDVPHTLMSYTEGRIHTLSLENLANGEYKLLDRVNATPESLCLYDLHALISLYGPNLKTATSNDTYVFSQEEKAYWIIWDAGGVDLIDASKMARDCAVDLNCASFSSLGLYPVEMQAKDLTRSINLLGPELERLTGQIMERLVELDKKGLLYTGLNNVAIAKGVVVEDVKTGLGNDIVYDNAFDNVIDLSGGDDIVILGKGGYDSIIGGEGWDCMYLPGTRRDYQWCGTREYALFVSDSLSVKTIGVECTQFEDDVVLI